MKSSKVVEFLLTVVFVIACAAEVNAAGVNFKDPRHAVGREDNIRVDAQIIQDSVSASAPVTVTYQIENLSSTTIAFADKFSAADYDSATRTITIDFGVEIPGPTMPHLVTIPAGQKRVFTGGATPHVIVPNIRTPWTSVPRFVQIRVNVLRDLQPFVALVEAQNDKIAPQRIGDDVFNRWVENVESVYLNTIPVTWSGGPGPSAGVDVTQASSAF